MSKQMAEEFKRISDVIIGTLADAPRINDPGINAVVCRQSYAMELANYVSEQSRKIIYEEREHRNLVNSRYRSFASFLLRTPRSDLKEAAEDIFSILPAGNERNRLMQHVHLQASTFHELTKAAVIDVGLVLSIGSTGPAVSHKDSIYFASAAERERIRAKARIDLEAAYNDAAATFKKNFGLPVHGITALCGSNMSVNPQGSYSERLRLWESPASPDYFEIGPVLTIDPRQSIQPSSGSFIIFKPQESAHTPPTMLAGMVRARLTLSPAMPG